MPMSYGYEMKTYKHGRAYSLIKVAVSIDPASTSPPRFKEVSSKHTHR
jgi:hypothetical protein